MTHVHVNQAALAITIGNESNKTCDDTREGVHRDGQEVGRRSSEACEHVSIPCKSTWVRLGCTNQATDTFISGNLSMSREAYLVDDCG